MDLTEACVNDLITWRRFCILVKGLPADSAFARWLDNKDNRKMASWSDEQLEAELGKVRG